MLELLSILVMAAALCYTLGVMMSDTRQGWALLAAMLVIFIPLYRLAVGWNNAVTRRSPRPGMIRRQRPASRRQHGGQRNSLWHRQLVLWASATTAASNGSVNSMHDSYTPLGGFVPMV